jgi:hypothetical protein
VGRCRNSLKQHREPFAQISSPASALMPVMLPSGP